MGVYGRKNYVFLPLNESLLTQFSCGITICRNGNSGRSVPNTSRQMDSQTRTTRSVAEVTKTKTFRSKTLL